MQSQLSSNCHVSKGLDIPNGPIFSDERPRATTWLPFYTNGPNVFAKGQGFPLGPHLIVSPVTFPLASPKSMAFTAESLRAMSQTQTGRSPGAQRQQ